MLTSEVPVGIATLGLRVMLRLVWTDKAGTDGDDKLGPAIEESGNAVDGKFGAATERDVEGILGASIEVLGRPAEGRFGAARALTLAVGAAGTPVLRDGTAGTLGTVANVLGRAGEDILGTP